MEVENGVQSHPDAVMKMTSLEEARVQVLLHRDSGCDPTEMSLMSEASRAVADAAVLVLDPYGAVHRGVNHEGSEQIRQFPQMHHFAGFAHLYYLKLP